MITLPNITEPPWRREEHYVGLDLVRGARAVAGLTPCRPR